EAENVFAKSLVQTGTFDIDVILSEKERIVRKSGVLEFFRAHEKMDDIGGLDQVKTWLKKRQAAFSEEARKFGLPRPKGILMIGIPGGGKSLTAKAVGASWRLPLLRLDVGKVFAGIVGSSEENMRRAIQMAEAVAPSILWVDELEKGFSGTGSSNQSDAGTAARVFGSFITWLQEKTSPVFVIATANNVDELPPEMMRKGRFDEIFFVDLPTLPERREIGALHVKRRRRREGAVRPCTKVVTKFNDPACLKLALTDPELEFEETIGERLVKVRGWKGSTLTAEAKIKASKSYDIGLQLTEEGTYNLDADWWGIEEETNQEAEKIQQKIIQTYAKHKVKAEVAKQGFTLDEEQ